MWSKIKNRRRHGTTSPLDLLWRRRSPASSTVFAQSLLQRDYFNPRLGVAFDRGGFVVEDVEDGVQLGDRQQITDPLGRVQELQIAARAPDGRVAADDLAQTAAVHIRHVRQIQQQFGLAAFDQLVNLALQLDVAFAEKNFAFNVEYGYVTAFALCNSHTRPPNSLGC